MKLSKIELAIVHSKTLGEHCSKCGTPRKLHSIKA
jgi:uncharacterized Zn finger protein (UPF0148 family)